MRLTEEGVRLTEGGVGGRFMHLYWYLKARGRLIIIRMEPSAGVGQYLDTKMEHE